jgi:hypothetical protein
METVAIYPYEVILNAVCGCGCGCRRFVVCDLLYLEQPCVLLHCTWLPRCMYGYKQEACQSHALVASYQQY